jgi:hypothetical protein
VSWLNHYRAKGRGESTRGMMNFSPAGLGFQSIQEIWLFDTGSRMDIHGSLIFFTILKPERVKSR